MRQTFRQSFWPQTADHPHTKSPVWKLATFCWQVLLRSELDQFNLCVSTLEAPWACAGDDSTWKMSDWEWDSRAFVAAPKKDQQEALSSNKKRKTDAVLGLCGVSARPCGGCRAAELEPLEFLRQADNSAGNNSWAKELTGRPLVKV